MYISGLQVIEVDFNKKTMKRLIFLGGPFDESVFLRIKFNDFKNMCHSN